MMTQQQLVEAVFDAIPDPVFLTDDDVRVVTANTAARRALGLEGIDPSLWQRRAGELLRCVNALESAGCGQAPGCQRCAVRTAVRIALSRGAVYRAPASLKLHLGPAPTEASYLVSAAPLPLRGETLAVVTLEDVTELTQLKGLLPICANCRRVRDERNYWQTVEQYFRQHHDIAFSHGICDDCMRKLYPGDDEEA